ncbi:MAG TPA: glycosyltransferase family 2 protein [Thermoanaerobacterium sp.]|nr:glycosyltransferase family 2 protein [Thermoanaerobacterium sp.]
MSNKIGIVTVTYNSGKVIEDFVMSLNKQKYKEFILIIVDNNSNDNTLEIINKVDIKFDYHIIRNNENYGVAKGNNIGIKYCEKINCNYILLLNNDTVFEEDLLDKLLEGCMKHRVSVVVPKIYYYEPKNLIWMAGGRLVNWKGSAKHFGYKMVDNGDFDESKYVNYSPTCCMLISIEVFKKIGYMDEKYFVYFDDTDFCARLAKKRIKILYYPRAVLWHKVSSLTSNAVSEFSFYYINRNWLYYLLKNEKGFYKVVSLLYFIVKRTARLLISNKNKRRLLMKTIIDGIKLYCNQNIIEYN